MSEERTRRDGLASAMQQSLAGVLATDNPAWTHDALAAGRAMMVRRHAEIDTVQTVLLVDRSPAVQRLWVVGCGSGQTIGRPWGPSTSAPASPAARSISRTPIGVFVNDANILGYRALGTYNENHIRGNGLKGMRGLGFRLADHR